MVVSWTVDDDSLLWYWLQFNVHASMFPQRIFLINVYKRFLFA